MISLFRHLTAGMLVFLILHLPAKAVDAYQLSEIYEYGKIRKGDSSFSVGKNSGVFLKVINGKQSRCLLLDQPGKYEISQIEIMASGTPGNFEFFSCNLKALALRLKTPAQLIVVPEPRGPITTTEQTSQFYEKTWEQVVLNRNEKIPAENLFATAIWYYKGNNPARSAYLLEKAYKQTSNPWLLELHQNAYSASSPDQIEDELKQTRNRIEAAYSPESNLALLIGIQNYKKDSGWNSLNTPLYDINKIKKVLVEEYSFNQDNIRLLPDATYQQLFDAIGTMKKKVTKRSNLLIYYAGHGWTDEDGNYFWIPSDGAQSPKSWIYTDFILNKIKALNSLHTLFIVDSCFGGALNNHETRGTIEEGTRQLYEKRSRQLITAGGLEPVADGGEGKNSVFASVFIDILENQPNDHPLSVEKLFSNLQPSVVKLSNQTPTYDRLPNSRDEWGQYYFIKKWSVSEPMEEPLPVQPQNENPTSLPAELMDDFNLTKPGEVTNNIAEIRLFGSQSVVSLADLLDKESISQLGAALSFRVKYKNKPVLLQLSYATSQKEQHETISFQNQNYNLPQTISGLEFKLGVRRVRKEELNQKTSESGVYYYWKRFRVEWDTSQIPNKKSNTEYVNIGYHMVNLAFYDGWNINKFIDAGFNYDFSLGLASLSGSTAVARTEKYNTDSSNFIAGAGLHPEVRIRFPVINLDLRLGAGAEYLWQPADDEGGAQSDNNRINSTLLSSTFYAVFNLGF